jgi:hypothetical protein
MCRCNFRPMDSARGALHTQLPARSFPGGFRTTAPGASPIVSMGRHPKPFTICGPEHSQLIAIQWGWRVVLKRCTLDLDAGRSACPKAARKTRKCRISRFRQPAALVPPAGTSQRNQTFARRVPSSTHFTRAGKIR